MEGNNNQKENFKPTKKRTFTETEQNAGSYNVGMKKKTNGCSGITAEAKTMNISVLLIKKAEIYKKIGDGSLYWLDICHYMG